MTASPPGLSARPTLSVRDPRQPAGRRRPSPSPISPAASTGRPIMSPSFRPDGDRVDLFAWLTLASGDETSFANAAPRRSPAGSTANTGGRGRSREDGPLGALALRLLAGRTDQRHSAQQRSLNPAGLPARSERADAIRRGARCRQDPAQTRFVSRVTGCAPARRSLGDLKLYRIPEPVTVAARSQKQVAFLEQPRVAVEVIHRRALDGEPAAPDMLFAPATTQDGLGEPLPPAGCSCFATKANGRSGRRGRDQGPRGRRGRGDRGRRSDGA